MLLLGDCLLKKEERTAPLLFQKLELIAVVSLESLINSAAVSAANSEFKPKECLPLVVSTPTFPLYIALLVIRASKESSVPVVTKPTLLVTFLSPKFGAMVKSINGLTLAPHGA